MQNIRGNATDFVFTYIYSSKKYINFGFFFGGGGGGVIIH